MSMLHFYQKLVSMVFPLWPACCQFHMRSFASGLCNSQQMHTHTERSQNPGWFAYWTIQDMPQARWATTLKPCTWSKLTRIVTQSLFSSLSNAYHLDAVPRVAVLTRGNCLSPFTGSILFCGGFSPFSFLFFSFIFFSFRFFSFLLPCGWMSSPDYLRSIELSNGGGSFCPANHLVYVYIQGRWYSEFLSLWRYHMSQAGKTVHNHSGIQKWI